MMTTLVACLECFRRFLLRILSWNFDSVVACRTKFFFFYFSVTHDAIDKNNKKKKNKQMQGIRMMCWRTKISAHFEKEFFLFPLDFKFKHRQCWQTAVQPQKKNAYKLCHIFYPFIAFTWNNKRNKFTFHFHMMFMSNLRSVVFFHSAFWFCSMRWATKSWSQTFALFLLWFHSVVAYGANIRHEIRKHYEKFNFLLSSAS